MFRFLNSTEFSLHIHIFKFWENNTKAIYIASISSSLSPLKKYKGVTFSHIDQTRSNRNNLQWNVSSDHKLGLKTWEDDKKKRGRKKSRDVFTLSNFHKFTRELISVSYSGSTFFIWENYTHIHFFSLQ